MAESRAAKLARLVRVQRQMERMAENELAHTIGERAAVEDTRGALVDAVGSLHPVHRGMAAVYASRFGTLDQRERQLSSVQVLQERRVLSEKTKADRLDKSASKAAEAEERAASDESLLDLLDAAIAVRHSDESPA